MKKGSVMSAVSSLAMKLLAVSRKEMVVVWAHCKSLGSLASWKKVKSSEMTALRKPDLMDSRLAEIHSLISVESSCNF